MRFCSLRSAVTALTLLSVAAVANASILYSESFSTDGTVLASPYDSWTNASGTGTDLSVSSATGLSFGSSDVDYKLSLGTLAGDTYLSFTLTVSTLPTSGYEYFIGFYDGSGYDARLWLYTADGVTYQLGISEASNTYTLGTTSFGLDSTVQVVLYYNASTDTVSLWAGSYDESIPLASVTGTDASTSAAGIYIRQAGSLDNGASLVYIDDIVVATDFDDLGISTVPEPTTFAAMVGLLMLGFVDLRRKRR